MTKRWSTVRSDLTTTKRDASARARNDGKRETAEAMNDIVPPGDLLARLSAAPSGSRDLDAEVAIACGWERVEVFHEDGVDVDWHAPNGRRVDANCPRLTTDLTTIVGEIERQLPGCVWAIINDWGGLHRASISIDPVIQDVHSQEDAATPCLALCIALLKAKEAQS